MSLLSRVIDAILVICHQKHMCIVILIGREHLPYQSRNYQKLSFPVKGRERFGCGTGACDVQESVAFLLLHKE
jgi:hypothetical protein